MPVILAFWHGQHFMTPFIKKSRASRQGPDLAASRRRVQRDRRRTAGHRHRARLRRSWLGVPSQGRRRRVQGNGAGARGGHNMALTADVPKKSRVAGLGIIMLAREVRPADRADRDGHQPVHPAQQLGSHHHQPAVRPRRAGRRRMITVPADADADDDGGAARAARGEPERRHPPRLCAGRPSGRGRPCLARPCR